MGRAQRKVSWSSAVHTEGLLSAPNAHDQQKRRDRERRLGRVIPNLPHRRSPNGSKAPECERLVVAMLASPCAERTVFLPQRGEQLSRSGVSGFCLRFRESRAALSWALRLPFPEARASSLTRAGARFTDAFRSVGSRWGTTVLRHQSRRP